MDFWIFDLFGRFNQYTCSGTETTNKHESGLQITISHYGVPKCEFIRSKEGTIKFYNDNQYIQTFTDDCTAVKWMKQLFQFGNDDQIIWHRQGEKGVSTPYSEERLAKLLELLVSNQIV